MTTLDIMKVLADEKVDPYFDNNDYPEKLQSLWAPFNGPDCSFIFRPLLCQVDIYERERQLLIPQTYIKLDGQKVHLPSEGAIKAESGNAYVTRCMQRLEPEDYELSEEYLEAKRADMWAYKGVMTQCTSMYIQLLQTKDVNPEYWKVKQFHVASLNFFEGFATPFKEFFLEEYPTDMKLFDSANPAPYIAAFFSYGKWKFEILNLDMEHYEMTKWHALADHNGIENALSGDYDKDLFHHAIEHLENL